MFSQIRSLLERHQQMMKGSLVAAASAHNTQFVATKATDAVQETVASAPKEPVRPTLGSIANYRKIDNLEKRFLVWTGKYKAITDVPDNVSRDVIEKARNKIRIRLANYMIALTVVGCVAFAIAGKQAAKRGESVAKMNVEWHQKLSEEEKAEK